MRQFLIGLCAVFACVMPLHAKEEQSSPELLIKAINNCYEDENKIGLELAKCALAKLKGLDNPHGYRAFLTDDSPNKTIEGNVTLIITDKYGDAMVCKGVAKEKIVFKECVSKKIPHYTPDHDLSIIPGT